MIWNGMLLFGVLFIINGIVIMVHSKLLENIRKKMPTDVTIFSGTSKGLLFLASTDVMLGVSSRGIIKEAFSIKSGWLRKSRVQELTSLRGRKIMLLSNIDDTLTIPQQKACQMAAKRYQLYAKH